MYLARMMREGNADLCARRAVVNRAKRSGVVDEVRRAGMAALRPLALGAEYRVGAHCESPPRLVLVFEGAT
jgi:hypothetical protein